MEESLKDKAKILLMDGEILEAIELLYPLVPESSGDYDTLFVTQTSYKTWSRRLQQGVAKFEDADIERNKNILAILGVIKSITQINIPEAIAENDVGKTSALIKKLSEEVKELSGKRLIVKCDGCGSVSHIDESNIIFDFEAVGASETKTESEIHYESYFTFHCWDCTNKIEVYFGVTEHEVAIHKYDDVKVENGELIDCPDFVSIYWDEHDKNQREGFF